MEKTKSRKACSPPIDLTAAVQATETTKLQLIAALSHRKSAAAMKAAVRTLDKSLADAVNALDALRDARGQAQAEAELLGAQADAFSLGAAHAQSHIERSPVAVDFLQVSILTKRWADTAAAQSWREGARVEMIPEPTNQADPNAIRLLCQGKMVGYVARENSLEIKERQSQGWVLAGWGFLKTKKGGRWGDGHVQARMENPVMGWSGYNPVESMQSNVARMEAELIATILPAAGRTRKRALSL